jgi:hypothetical protein
LALGDFVVARLVGDFSPQARTETMASVQDAFFSVSIPSLQAHGGA